jgi:hypothetical protein
VTTVLPKIVSSARSIRLSFVGRLFLVCFRLDPATPDLLESGISFPGLGSLSMKTFESDLPFVMRFMIDTVRPLDGLIGSS